ncbi:MAG: sugar phosphate isomerase/epimerase family protein [Blastocatellia bacterium]
MLLLLAALPLLAMDRAGAQPAAAGLSAALKQRLAVQLWSFRDDFARDVPGTLKRVRELGFTNVELAGYYGMTARQFRAELDKAGLNPIGMHVEYEAARDRIDEVIAEARILGVREVGVPWIDSPFTRKDCLAAIEVFNRAGRKLAARGMAFSYHLHGYEFVPDEGGTGTLFDLMMARTDPRFVHLQLDTYHVAFPGQDPVALMRKHPGRFRSLHLKDLRKDAAGDNSGDFREADARPLGQGIIDWPAVLKGARSQSVRWYIIEEETSDVWRAISASLRYLATLKE